MLSPVIRCLGLIGLLLLSGCTSLKSQQETTLPVPIGKPADLHAAHVAQLSYIKQFHMQARMGVQANGKGSSGGIRWRHQPQDDDISILSPIGGTAAKIIANSEGVTLTTNDGKILTANNAESLTQEHLGWRLPMSGLPDWAIGRPAKRLTEEIHWDSIGRITKLKQDGWYIEYLEYMEAAGYRLPRRIMLQNDNLTLRLVIESWSELSQMTQPSPQ